MLEPQMFVFVEKKFSACPGQIKPPTSPRLTQTGSSGGLIWPGRVRGEVPGVRGSLRVAGSRVSQVLSGASQVHSISVLYFFNRDETFFVSMVQERQPFN